jgi:hypothetical protein
MVFRAFLKAAPIGGQTQPLMNSLEIGS